MKKSTPINFLNLNFLYIYTLILYFKEFTEYNNKPDIEVKIEIIKIYKID